MTSSVSDKNNSNISVFSAIGLHPFNAVFLSYSLFSLSLTVRFITHIFKVFLFNLPTKAIENGQQPPFAYVQGFNYQEIYVLLMAILLSYSLYIYLKIRQKSKSAFVLGIVSLWLIVFLFNLFEMLHWHFVTNKPITGFFDQIFFNSYNLFSLFSTAIFLFNYHQFTQNNHQIIDKNKSLLSFISAFLISIAIILNLVTFIFGLIINRSAFWTNRWYRQAKLNMPYRVYQPTYMAKNYYPSKFFNFSANSECAFEYINPKGRTSLSIRQNSVGPEYDITQVFAARYKNNAVEAREIDFPISKNSKAYLVNAGLTNTKTLTFISPVDVHVNIVSQVNDPSRQLSDDEIIKIAQSLK